MKMIRNFVMLAASAILVSCAGAGSQMKKDLNTLQVSCEPSILEVTNDKISAEVTIVFPEGYFDKTAVMVLTPVLNYPGGKRTGKSFIFQGEGVKANYSIVPVSGKTARINVEFDYIPEMEQCRLELRSSLMIGEKKVDIPIIRVADGCLATSKLVYADGEFTTREDGFSIITSHTTETNILFDVNSSYVKNNRTNNTAVDLYRQYLRELNADSRYKITGTEIVAYASPEGGEELNANLSKDRASSALKAWDGMSGGIKVDSMSTRSMGQDWEGFKEAIETSDLEDRHLILRLLSMYSDPAVREAEIRNLSFIYDDLKKEVFPGLRRATFVVSAEHVGYSDEELVEMAAKQLAYLSEPEVLHLATISESRESKAFYYRLAVQRWKSPKGYFNLAVMALEEGKNEVALSYLAQCDEDADVLNLRGVISMRRGAYVEAGDYFRLSGTEFSKMNRGTLHIIKGEYNLAAQVLEGTGSCNEALAYILAGKYSEALSIEPADPRGWYIKAIAAARAADPEGVTKYLEKACESEEYAEKAKKDVEFVRFR